MQQRGEVEQGAIKGRIAGEHVVGNRHQRAPVGGFQGVQDAIEVVAIDCTEHVPHARFFDAATAVRNRLIEQGQRIAGAGLSLVIQTINLSNT